MARFSSGAASAVILEKTPCVAPRWSPQSAAPSDAPTGVAQTAKTTSDKARKTKPSARSRSAGMWSESFPIGTHASEKTMLTPTIKSGTAAVEMPESAARSTRKALEKRASEKRIPSTSSARKAGPATVKHSARSLQRLTAGRFAAGFSGASSTPMRMRSRQSAPGINASQKMERRSSVQKKRKRLARAGPTKAPAASSD